MSEELDLRLKPAALRCIQCDAVRLQCRQDSVHESEMARERRFHQQEVIQIHDQLLA